MLRRLALEERPLGDVAELLSRLELAGVERRIDLLRSELQGVDPDTDAERYSDVFAQLIALEKERRDLRSRE
jgi:DNA primase